MPELYSDYKFSFGELVVTKEGYEGTVDGVERLEGPKPDRYRLKFDSEQQKKGAPSNGWYPEEELS